VHRNGCLGTQNDTIVPLNFLIFANFLYCESDLRLIQHVQKKQQYLHPPSKYDVMQGRGANSDLNSRIAVIWGELPKRSNSPIGAVIRQQDGSPWN
jgi:hypothetical protein